MLMKKLLLCSMAFFAMTFTSHLMAQVNTTDSPTRTSSSGLKCCAAIYVNYPAHMGQDASTKTLTRNPFGGRHEGIDLSYDVLDPNGGLVPNGSSSLSVNSNGELIIDAGKLPAGKQYRLRLKAGNDVEYYNF